MTQLFVYHQPSLAAARVKLSRNAPRFGEALQLVNVLRDSIDDDAAGRRFIPEEVSRIHLLGIARSGLDAARDYIDALKLENADAGILSFSRLPVELAELTLQYVEDQGPGAKVPRVEVAAILSELQRHAKGNDPQRTGLSDLNVGR